MGVRSCGEAGGGEGEEANGLGAERVGRGGEGRGDKGWRTPLTNE